MNNLLEPKYKKLFIITSALFAVGTLFGIICGSVLLDTVIQSSYGNYVGFSFGGGMSIGGAFTLLFALAFSLLAYLLKIQRKQMFAIGSIFLCAWASVFFSFSAIDCEFQGGTLPIICLPIICTIISIVNFILSIAYLVMKESDRKSLLAQQAEKENSFVLLHQGAVELENLKKLLDCQIITEDEFAIKKSKIMIQYKIAPTVKQSQSQPDTQYSQFSQLLQADGTYKFSDIVLTLAKAKYDFKNADSGISLLSGTYILDSTKKVVTLFKPDKSLMQLSIDESGNLVTANGNVYEKQ